MDKYLIGVGDNFSLSLEAALLIIGFVSAVLGRVSDLKHEERRRRIIAGALICIALVALGVSFIGMYAKVLKLRTLTYVGVEEVSEASGGTVIGDYAYVVDDEKSEVFVFPFKNDYLESSPRKLTLQDNRPDKPSLVCGKAKNENEQNKETLTDLEGAATDGTDLFLVTSHANQKGSGKEQCRRQWFLRVSVNEKAQIGQVTGSAQLRKPIEDFLKKNGIPLDFKEGGVVEGMHIEGLAIDWNKKTVFLGFRAPLSRDGYAIILESTVDEMLNGNPNFKLHKLILHHESSSETEKHGITSMDYDPKSKELLILSNAEHREQHYGPILWRWKPESSREVEQPIQKIEIPFSLEAHKGQKLEVLLAPPNKDRLYMMLDTNGVGSQTSFGRKSLGLPN